MDNEKNDKIFKILAEIHGCKESLEDCNSRKCNHFYTCGKLQEAFLAFQQPQVVDCHSLVCPFEKKCADLEAKLTDAANAHELILEKNASLNTEVKRLRDGLKLGRKIIMQDPYLSNSEEKIDEFIKVSFELLTPTKTHSGFCSAHRDGEDSSCRICYPTKTVKGE